MSFDLHTTHKIVEQTGTAGSAPAPIDADELPPAYVLYDAKEVGVAAFWGAPLASGILMALNYVRLKEWALAIVTVCFALGITVAIALLFQNAGVVGRLAASAVGISASWGLARAIQGRAIAKHVARGGEIGTLGATFAITIGTAVLVVLVAVLARTLLVAAIPTVPLGAHGTLRYTGTATKPQAESLAAALATRGLGSQASIVEFADGASGRTVTFLVSDAGVTEQGLASFEQLVREIAPAAGGFPVTLRLVDAVHRLRAVSTVGLVAVGVNDKVYYLGSMTESVATALGEQLRAAKYFTDIGNVVILAKRDDGTTVSFVANSAFMMGSNLTPAYFEDLARKVAPSIGGLPIRMRIIDPHLQPILDKKVQ